MDIITVRSSYVRSQHRTRSENSAQHSTTANNENVASKIVENVDESYTYQYNSTVHKHFVGFLC